MEKFKINKKILTLFVSLVVSCVFFLTFSSSIQDWRLYLLGAEQIEKQSESQMKVEIVRDGSVVTTMNSAKTNSINYINGIPDDIVANPPTINAKVGDKIRISDISYGSVGAWDFQTYKNGSPFHTQQYFYGNDEDPFPYEITAESPGEYTFYLNVYNQTYRNWSSWGDYRVVGTYKNEVTGQEFPMWWYFTHIRVKVEDAADPFVVVTGKVSPNPSTLSDGKATIEITNNAKIEGLRTGEVVESWELKTISSDNSINLTKDFNPSSSVSVSNDFENITITKSTTFALRAKVTTNRGTFEGVTFVNAQVEGEAPPPPKEPGDVEAKGRIDAQPGEGYSAENGVAYLTYTYPEYSANTPKVVKIKIDASGSTSDPYSISQYYYAIRKNDDSFSDNHSHVIDWTGSSSVVVDMVIEPDDVNPDGRVDIDFRVGARDSEGNTDYYYDNEGIIRVSVVYRDPEVSINTPELFLPKSFTDISTLKNEITWDYKSDDDLPLDHYVVTLDNVTNSFTEPVNVINEETTTDNSLIVEGEEKELFQLKVVAYDSMGNSGEAVVLYQISDLKPVASFTINGTKKMFKEVMLDGLDSLNYTNKYLHESLFQTDFENEKSYFIIEPVDAGLSVNDIKILNKEVSGNSVIVKGKPQISVRFDKSGNYRIGYTIWNGFRQSDMVWKEIFIAPELYPILNFSLSSPLVLRDPTNNLKSEFGVNFEYRSLDDEIDTDKSILYLKYDTNNDGNYLNDGAASSMYIRKGSQSLIPGITIKNRNFGEANGYVNMISDNANKNFLGRILFNFSAIEKPSIPNYEAPPEIPLVGDIETNTLSIEDSLKTILIDNNAPDFTFSISSEGNVELWFLEAGGVDFNTASVTAILNSLNFYGITATIHYEDGGIMKTISN